MLAQELGLELAREAGARRLLLRWIPWNLKSPKGVSSSGECLIQKEEDIWADAFIQSDEGMPLNKTDGWLLICTDHI